jgi:coenzyme F420 hydrogenase subunit beta
VLKVAQDGGAATALLLHALKSSLISRAVVSGIDPNKPLFPIPKVATTAEDIVSCAGTRYFYSPNILALNEAAKEGGNIGFAGTPCQINALRKAQSAELKRYAALKLLIGLMCSECYDYEGLVKSHLQQKLGIDPRDILKINIKGKLNLTMKDGQVTSLPLAEVKQYTRKSCAHCHDFSATLADISVGGLGLNGWTFTVIRSQGGEEIFSDAERSGIIETRNASEEPQALSLLTKLSIKKSGR